MISLLYELNFKINSKVNEKMSIDNAQRLKISKFSHDNDNKIALWREGSCIYFNVLCVHVFENTLFLFTIHSRFKSFIFFSFLNNFSSSWKDELERKKKLSSSFISFRKKSITNFVDEYYFICVGTIASHMLFVQNWRLSETWIQSYEIKTLNETSLLLTRGFLLSIFQIST